MHALYQFMQSEDGLGLICVYFVFSVIVFSYLVYINALTGTFAFLSASKDLALRPPRLHRHIIFFSPFLILYRVCRAAVAIVSYERSWF